MPEEQLAESEVQALNTPRAEPAPYGKYLTGILRPTDALDQLASVWAADNVPAEELRKALDLATDAFGDRDTAMLWLQDRNIQTGDKPPVSILGRPNGLQIVGTVLGQIKYGIIG